MTNAARIARLGAVITLVFAAGCTSGADRVPLPSGEVGLATVQVEARSLTSVVVVPGTVVAAPGIMVEAPAEGTVTLNEAGVAGRAVRRDQVLGTVGQAKIKAAVSGTIDEVLAGSGALVARRSPVLVVRYQGFGVWAEVPVTEQYRLYQGAVSGRATIESGPAGLDCELARPAAVSTGPAQAGEPTQSVAALCLLPVDAPVVEGLVAKIGLTTAQVDHAASVPLESVSGRAGQGLVTQVFADGTSREVAVELGISDGAYIQITSGLQVGDTIASRAPGIG